MASPTPFGRTSFADLKRKNLERKNSASPSPTPSPILRQSPMVDDYPTLGSPRMSISPVWNKNKDEIIKMAKAFKPIPKKPDEPIKLFTEEDAIKFSRHAIRKLNINLEISSESNSESEIEEIHKSETESDEEYDESRYSGKITSRKHKEHLD